jgi:hypothetical protein
VSRLIFEDVVSDLVGHREVGPRDGVKPCEILFRSGLFALEMRVAEKIAKLSA